MAETVKKVAKPKKDSVKKAPVVKAVAKSTRAAQRKQLDGIVVGTNSQKTISVAVDTYKKHPLYQKRFKSTKKFAVHDEEGKAKVGDKVQIIETRPISKTKKFRLGQIYQSSKGGE